ncbi:hypothetical protein HMPREF9443_01902 [Phascolarctobacterium succinatutens YIT 12067]|uniref:Uncharacterized protein n=1 Tax=Phascolarctobacterium succinatutens YIT 12067 TaxID=626939 RepID=E8LGI8_9FIRM|nr:hypothetical protein HMPREF9443_01902 [Phascolarctobacterium succinatutens YIT 12067]
MIKQSKNKNNGKHEYLLKFFQKKANRTPALHYYNTGVLKLFTAYLLFLLPDKANALDYRAESLAC